MPQPTSRMRLAEPEAERAVVAEEGEERVAEEEEEEERREGPEGSGRARCRRS